jgi:transcriptional antiterminator RfaH
MSALTIEQSRGGGTLVSVHCELARCPEQDMYSPLKQITTVSGEAARADAPSGPGIFPQDLLDFEDYQCPGEWWLAHTKPRQEKAVAAALYCRQVCFYLPLVNRRSITRGRSRVASVPLFPGYVFIRGNENARLLALKTNRLITIQPVPDRALLHKQLGTFARLIAAGAPLVRETRLVPGERVQVKTGPFRGTEGVIVRRNRKTELVVSIDFLQQGASLLMDDCMLEPV